VIPGKYQKSAMKSRKETFENWFYREGCEECEDEDTAIVLFNLPIGHFGKVVLTANRRE
jgi:hypothetical protein